MRKILLVAMLSAAFVVPADAQDRGRRSRAGTVTAIDAAGKTFDCHWKTRDWTYRIGDKTAFLIGRTAGTFSDLKVGANVRVSYHLVGKDAVADSVVIRK